MVLAEVPSLTALALNKSKGSYRQINAQASWLPYVWACTDQTSVTDIVQRFACLFQQNMLHHVYFSKSRPGLKYAVQP